MNSEKAIFTEQLVASYLQVRYFDDKLEFFSTFLHTGVEVTNNTRYNASHLLNTINTHAVRTSHCVGLTTAGLTVCQNCGIITCKEIQHCCTMILPTLVTMGEVNFGLD